MPSQPPPNPRAWKRVFPSTPNPVKPKEDPKKDVAAPAPSDPTPVPDPTPAAPEIPEALKWNPSDRKVDLLAVAKGLGLTVDENNTKAEIIAALEAAKQTSG